MKIQCDVCDKDEALVFCTADEAALCEACDHRVHHANKLASKHQRFSLLQPSDNQFPVCDICQERRAFLFCQQDRAILCRECDLPIHAVNEHTQKHDRFLLTGLTLSCASAPNSTASVSATVSNSPIAESSTSNAPIATASTVDNEGGEPTNSISDFMIETLPDWHFEEFLDSSSAPFGFCKTEEARNEEVGRETMVRLQSRRFRPC